MSGTNTEQVRTRTLEQRETSTELTPLHNMQCELNKRVKVATETLESIVATNVHKAKTALRLEELATLVKDKLGVKKSSTKLYNFMRNKTLGADSDEDQLNMSSWPSQELNDFSITLEARIKALLNESQYSLSELKPADKCKKIYADINVIITSLYLEHQEARRRSLLASDGGSPKI